MLVRLVVFDLDGTLIDSRRDLADSANLMLASYGASSLTEEEIGRMVGSGAAQLVARALRRADVTATLEEALARFLHIYNERLTVHTRPYAGVPEMLGRLTRENAKLALLTNKPLEASVRILQTFGLNGYFQESIGGDGPWPRKPAPDALRRLMENALEGPASTVLVGDSEIDLQTARNAGVRICFASYGFGYSEKLLYQVHDEDLIADTAARIPEVLGIGGHSRV
jgi:phosphoglycolate phosphatase